MTTRAERETLLRHCRSGLVTHALAIVWDNPAILADAGCEVLVAGRNPTMVNVMEILERRVLQLDVGVFRRRELEKPGWIGTLAMLFLDSPRALGRLLAAVDAGAGDSDVQALRVILSRLLALNPERWMSPEARQSLANISAAIDRYDPETRLLITAVTKAIVASMRGRPD